MADDKKGNVLQLKLPEGNTIEYRLDNQALGAGRIGEVFRGYDNSGKDWAIKICKSGFEKSFDENVKTIRGQSIDHIIPFTKVGMTGGGNFINTAVMEYGGSDLKAVHDELSKALSKDQINASAAKAFQYKVLYTVVEALEEAQKQALCHGDLIPSNILCGFELQEEMSDLEDKLINGEIRLCDRAGIKEVTTAFVKDDVSSVYSQDPKFIMAFLDLSRKDISLDGDIHSFFHLFSWLEEKAEHKFPLASAKKYLDLLLTVSDDGEKIIYPALELIKKSLRGVIEKDGYFELREVVKADGKKYPIVRRPIDQFCVEWKGKTLTQLTDLNKLYSVAETPSRSSYQHFLTKGGSQLGSKEKEQMGIVLGEVMLRSAYQIAQEHSAMIKLRLEETEKKKALETESNTRKNELKSLKDSYDSSNHAFQEHVSHFIQDPTQGKAEAVKTLTDQRLQSFQALDNKKALLDRMIVAKETEIEVAKRRVKGYDPVPLEEALGFIMNTVHNALPKVYQQKFETFIEKNNTLCHEVAAAKVKNK